MRGLPALLVLPVVLCASLSAKPLQWRTDYAQALKQASESDRDLFVLVSKTDSATHRRFAKLWEDDELSRTINRDYVPLLLSSPDPDEPKLGVSGPPSVVIQAADGTIKARLSHPAFKQPVDVSVWIERVETLHPGLEKRFEKLKDHAEKIDDAVELANACIELGLGAEAVLALEPSVADVQIALDKDAARHPQVEDRDQELIEQHRDISLLLADARWMAASQKCIKAEEAAKAAEETYDEHWDWLLENFDQRLAQAAMVRAYRKFTRKDGAAARKVLQTALNALPLHARALEMRFWLGLYAFWAKDFKLAISEFEAIVRTGPADDVLVEAAAAQVSSLKKPR